MAVEIDGTSKGLLGAFGLFALGSGIVTLVYGVILLLRYATTEYNFGVFNLFTISILLVVVGSLIIIVVILGVIGALTDMANLRLATLVLVFFLFAILAAVGVWGMVSVKTDRMQNSIHNDMSFINNTKYDDLKNVSKAKADYLYKTYKCCGFSDTVETQGSSEGKPEICCIEPGCSAKSDRTDQDYFQQGCAAVYYGTKAKAVFHLAILALVAAGLTLIGLILYGVVSQRARGGYAVVSRG